MAFWYFGYGANMCATALRAKGIDPLHSEPATLADHRFAFALKLFAPFVGGVSTVLPSRGERAHGVLHLLPDGAREILDAIEGRGFLYDRRGLDVVTYSGFRTQAEVYVGLDQWLEEGLRPTNRYRNILLRGAEASGLAAHHVAMLRDHPIEPPRSSRSPRVLTAPWRRVTPAEIEERCDLLALAGFVFELAADSPFTRYVRECRPNGRDFTAALVQMMEHAEPIEAPSAHPRWTDLTFHQQAFVGPFLESLSRSHRYVGRLRDGGTYSINPAPISHPVSSAAA